MPADDPNAKAGPMGQKLAEAATALCKSYHSQGVTYSQPKRSFGEKVRFSDCSSFVQSTFEKAGFASFWGGRGCAQTGCMRGKIASKGGGYHKNAQLGDVVMWQEGATGHVGIITKVASPTMFELTAMGNHGCGPYGPMTWQTMTRYGAGGAAGFKGYWTAH